MNSKMLAVALLLAVGATGFVSGHVTGSYRGEKACEPRREHAGFAGMLQDSLNLTDAERDTVRAILVKHRPEIRAMMDPIRLRMDSLRANINDEIATRLTAGQQQRFAAMRERWRAERARHDSAATAEGRR